MEATTVIVAVLVVGVLSTTAHDMHVERLTAEGRVLGRVVYTLGRAVEEYRGIPFAEPPIGHLRFRPPRPKTAWEGTLNATGRLTACHQVTVPGITLDGATITEDCLHLNVWVPESAVNAAFRRPVLVWIHGGGLTFGTANQAVYNGAVLSALADVLVVAMNYRLGIMGFMNANTPDAPGNVGFMDQNMALKWVHRNIEYFGGDRERVTLFGESAGSTSVHAHILSPMSEGLFKRAVLMSGIMYSIDTWETVEESMAKGDKVASAVGCSRGGNISLSSNPEEIVDCMRHIPAAQLFNVSVEVAAPKFAPFSPTYHNEFFPRKPLVAVKRGFFPKVDVIAGVTSDEAAGLILLPPVKELLVEDMSASSAKEITDSLRAAMWKFLKGDLPDVLQKYENEVTEGDKNTLRRQYIDYVSDRLFNCPLEFFAEQHTKRGNKVFAYVFDHKWSNFPVPRWMGVPHAFDIPFVFGQPYTEDSTSVDGRMSKAIIRMLASFSENGIPELPQTQTWPQYTNATPTMMLMGQGNFSLIHGFRAAYCERWRSLY
ncbi:hypothetical protein HPB52_024951 [Rhipicephalus sanguineus]|uniref:Carboxylic ester hydrolase n=2 Tax=Rhipicephalus sanguineus TaxID=34632 RepID=A0A9D4PB68_RHISA|nr:hypothetical protein HPB52_024951 [Rhipicephalus sanguineus]